MIKVGDLVVVNRPSGMNISCAPGPCFRGRNAYVVREVDGRCAYVEGCTNFQDGKCWVSDFHLRVIGRRVKKDRR